MTRIICAWCDTEGQDMVQVSEVEQPTRGPSIAYACAGCRDTYGILPLDRHPPGSTGAPLAVTSRPLVGRQDGTPIIPEESQ